MNNIILESLVSLVTFMGFLIGFMYSFITLMVLPTVGVYWFYKWINKKYRI